MPRPPKIHQGKQPHRLHYIPEWAERRGISQADIVRALGADKGTVSRWFSGTLPTDQYMIDLVAFFGLEEVADLFRHPDDEWMTRLLRGRSKDEQERIQKTIETAFPRRA